jgi:hypothetical protein
VLHIGVGNDQAYGEQDADTIYVLNDGMPDTIYCSTSSHEGDPGDQVILVGGRDPLDTISFCPTPTVQRHVPLRWRIDLALHRAGLG